MEEIRLDAATQALDPAVQTVVVDAARTWVRSNELASASPDALRLLSSDITARASIYEVEIDVAGTIAHLNVSIADDGAVDVRPAE